MKPLSKLIELLPSFTITKDGEKYLTRYYLFLKDRRFGNIFIHHFHKSDLDIGTNGKGLLHSHPWAGVSFIVSGGYWEERRTLDCAVFKRKVKPLTFNFLSKKDFHRVDLLNEDKGAWSIFFTGSRSNKADWYFWDRETNKTIHWKEVEGAIE